MPTTSSIKQIMPHAHPSTPTISVKQNIIQFAIPALDTPLLIRVDPAPGCGGVTWPAGDVLARYLAHRGTLSGKRVLELGSGTGLVGLVAGVLGATVTITDQAPLIHIMTANVALNGLSDVLSVRELNWGDPLPADLPAQDLVLAADCVYFEPAFPLLVKTLCDLVPPAAPTQVLFCYKKRRKADKRFFMLLKKHFNWSQVDDDPHAADYSRDAISLLRLVRKTPSP